MYMVYMHVPVCCSALLIFMCCDPLQFKSGVQQFEFFVSGHMDILANDPSHDDIIQLALLQPNASEVYVQASARVRGDRRKSWFNWR